ncbi:TPR repeat-containing protein [Candidatus Magnetomorum sp. HK-1]|nr:TPR repeat-containing protein [Candidatus Magnetomorum sp. HK-1]
MNSLFKQCLFVLIVSLIVFQPICAKPNELLNEQSKYHVLTETDHFRVPEIHKIFKQVVAAADISSNRVPWLMLTKDDVDPWVFCLKSGAVVISQKAIDVCYQNVDNSVGDARISLLIGHELAHLAKDDFWEQSAFAFSSPKQKETSSNAMSDLFENVMKKKELKADEYGFFYSSLAGFDVQLVLDYQGENFFQQLETHMNHDVPVESNCYHPPADLRTQTLYNKIIHFQKDLDIFNNGIYLYQVGKYSAALNFLNAFKEKYPGRAVFNTLGLIHYELAMDYLRKCKPQKAEQFMLATIVDTRTRAENLRGVQGSRTKKPDEHIFKIHIEAAIDHFKMSKKKDPFYLPARINLSSALILADYYNEALTVLNEALSITKEKNDVPPLLTAQIKNNLAIARYRDGLKIDVDLSSLAIDYLSQAIELYPKIPAPYYNLAVLSGITEQYNDTNEYFQQFLAFDATGNYAAIAENALDITHTNKQYYPLDIIGPSPIPLKQYQYMDAETDQKILTYKLEHKSYIIDGHVIDTYINDDMYVLCINRVVQLVDCLFESQKNFSEIKVQLQSPVRVLETLAGIKVLVYENFALKIFNNQVVRVIHFRL